MHVVMSFEDGTEVWYEVDSLSICRDAYGLSAVGHLGVPGTPERPAGDYVEIRNAKLSRIAGVPV